MCELQHQQLLLACGGEHLWRTPTQVLVVVTVLCPQAIHCTDNPYTESALPGWLCCLLSLGCSPSLQLTLRPRAETVAAPAGAGGAART